MIRILLTHWGQVTHICVNKLTIIGSDNGLMPGRRQAIIWTNARKLLIGPLGTNFSEILVDIYTFLIKIMHSKMSSGKWQPFFSRPQCVNRCSSLMNNNDPIRSQFCTCHDSCAVMTCAKLWPDWINRIVINAKRLSQEFSYDLINPLWNVSEAQHHLNTSQTACDCHHDMPICQNDIHHHVLCHMIGYLLFSKRINSAHD